MNCIDFDAYFTDYLNHWIEASRAKYKTPEKMEDAMPEVYLSFLNTPMEWLEGATPGKYYERYSDAPELCNMIKAYLAEGIPVPDPLMDRLSELDDQPALLALALDKTATCEARMHAITLLRELESSLPMVDFIRWQVERVEAEDLLDHALESLREMGEAVLKPIKIGFLAAKTEGKEALLDVLCDFPDADDAIFQFALTQFEQSKDKRALYASYLAKLGNDRALEALHAAADAPQTNYIDFIEIRSAIERLGSEASIRDFSQDPTYRAVRRMQG